MPQLIETPVPFPQEGIRIDEFVGRISTGENRVSIGRLSSRQGWSEPAQRPDFDEYTVVLAGALHIRSLDSGETTVVRAGQAVLVSKGEKIQYSTPEADGADYIAGCLPAFASELAHRDPE